MIKLLLWMVNNTNTDDTKLKYITFYKDYYYSRNSSNLLLNHAIKLFVKNVNQL